MKQNPWSNTWLKAMKARCRADMNRNALLTLKIILYSLFASVILIYSFFQAKKLIAGPIIDIYTPQNGATYNQALVLISGQARNVAYLNLDDKPIFTDK